MFAWSASLGKTRCLPSSFTLQNLNIHTLTQLFILYSVVIIAQSRMLAR
jgi:hypothetical protein